MYIKFVIKRLTSATSTNRTKSDEKIVQFWTLSPAKAHTQNKMLTDARKKKERI